jgi:hypothetical protein
MKVGVAMASNRCASGSSCWMFTVMTLSLPAGKVAHHGLHHLAVAAHRAPEFQEQEFLPVVHFPVEGGGSDVDRSDRVIEGDLAFAADRMARKLLPGDAVQRAAG